MKIERTILLVLSVRVAFSAVGCNSAHAQGDHCSWDSSYGCGATCDDGLVCDNISSTCLPSDYYDHAPPGPGDTDPPGSGGGGGGTPDAGGDDDDASADASDDADDADNADNADDGSDADDGSGVDE